MTRENTYSDRLILFRIGYWHLILIIFIAWVKLYQYFAKGYVKLSIILEVPWPWYNSGVQRWRSRLLHRRQKVSVQEISLRPHRNTQKWPKSRLQGWGLHELRAIGQNPQAGLPLATKKFERMDHLREWAPYHGKYSQSPTIFYLACLFCHGSSKKQEIPKHVFTEVPQ